jgi:exodeoxyribonuclease-3
MPLTIATWNVNGIRARQEQVQAFLEREQPDVLCLQELKAVPEQIPIGVTELEGYWSYWHGEKGYSGVALLIRQARFPGSAPVFVHPNFDFEHRIVMAELPMGSVVSVYVPNGGKDFDAKIRFLRSLVSLAAEYRAARRPLILCGDLNVAHRNIDVHAKELKPGAIGQRDDERALFDDLLSQDLADVQRGLHPDTPDIYTWWPPWRQMRQRNIGWRIDYLLASPMLADQAVTCVAHREVGTSDHGPVVATFNL